MASLNHFYAYLLIFGGVVEFLICCFWGFMGATPYIQHYRAFAGAHNQFASNAAMLIGCGVAFYYVKLSPTMQLFTVINLYIGAWLNPFAYCFACITNYAAPFWGPVPHWKGLITDGSLLSTIQLIMLLVTGITDIIGLLCLSIGLYKGRANYVLLSQIQPTTTKKD